MIFSRGITVLLFSALVAVAKADNSIAPTRGEMKMSGEIIETACMIDYPDREQWVEFGSLTTRDILRQSASSLQREFHVRLVGCTPASQVFPGLVWQHATVTFISDTPQGDDQFIRLRGEAKGLAIRLSDREGNRIILGQPTVGYAIKEGSDRLDFTATLVPLSKHISAGNFYASVHFFMDYL